MDCTIRTIINFIAYLVLSLYNSIGENLSEKKGMEVIADYLKKALGKQDL